MLKDRKTGRGNIAVFRVGLSVCNEDLMPVNVESDGVQTATHVWDLNKDHSSGDVDDIEIWEVWSTRPC